MYAPQNISIKNFEVRASWVHFLKKGHFVCLQPLSICHSSTQEKSRVGPVITILLYHRAIPCHPNHSFHDNPFRFYKTCNS